MRCHLGAQAVLSAAQVIIQLSIELFYIFVPGTSRRWTVDLDSLQHPFTSFHGFGVAYTAWPMILDSHFTSR